MAEKDFKARIAAARAEGYTDAEIADYLVAQGEINIAEARKEGYEDAEILDFLAGAGDPKGRLAYQPPAPPAPPAPPPGPPRQQGFTFRGNEPLTTTIDVINEALLGGVEGAYNLGAMLTDPIAELIAGEDAVKAAQAQRRNFFEDVARTFTTQDRPIAREIGRTLAPASAVGRAAGLTVPLAQSVPVAGNFMARILQAAQSGGRGSGRTAAQTVAMPRLQRFGQLGERVIGGTGAGAATAALADQDIQTGALGGAGLPVVASVLKRVGGFAGDITQMPRQKAAQIIRKALGDNVDKARAEFARLSPDDRRLAEQVLIEAEIEPDTFFGLGGIAQRELQPPGVNPMRETLEAQAAAREGRLAEAAGGATMEEVRAATREGRREVTEAMRPTREAMYERAGVASQVVPEAERIAQTARARADEITGSGFVPRMRGLEERAVGQAELMETVPPVFPEAGALGRTREIAESAGRRADEAIAAQIGLRDTANDMYQLVDDLAAEGMQPMRAADLIGSLRGKMRDPEILAGSMEERVIKNVIRQIEKATDANGMLNPRALGKIRRSGLNEIVKTLSTRMGGEPSRTGTPEAAQATVLGLRQMIDDTLKRGGAGDLVDQFIQGSERGYAAVNRGELSGEVLRLYKQDPKTASEFLALVGGDRPKTVGKIMRGGPESESFVGAFAGDPSRLGAIQQSAREMETLNRMQELRAAGAGPAANLMVRERPGLLSRGIAAATLSPFPAMRIGAVGAEQVEKAIMAPRVQRQLGEAFTSGQAMNRMLQTLPSSARISEAISRMSPEVRNIIAQSIIDYDQFGNYTGPQR